MEPDVLVLFSGGVDSTACIHFYKELGLKPTYVHRKYYMMKEDLKGINLNEVKEMFEL